MFSCLDGGNAPNFGTPYLSILRWNQVKIELLEISQQNKSDGAIQSKNQGKTKMTQNKANQNIQEAIITKFRWRDPDEASTIGDARGQCNYLWIEKQG